MERADCIRELAARICAIHMDHPLRVGIDGVDASGKTHLADELAKTITGRRVIRASIDGFHNPRAMRYARGRLSPDGYYKDSFDHQKLIEKLLEPLGRLSDWNYVPAVFDYRTDQPVQTEIRRTEQSAILLFDGIFLFRPELKAYFDFKIFVRADFSVTVPHAIQRALARDETSKEERRELLNQYQQRYVPGQKLYFQQANPEIQADIIVDNTDFANPGLIIQKHTET